MGSSRRGDRWLRGFSVALFAAVAAVGATGPARAEATLTAAYVAANEDPNTLQVLAGPRYAVGVSGVMMKAHSTTVTFKVNDASVPAGGAVLVRIIRGTTTVFRSCVPVLTVRTVTGLRAGDYYKLRVGGTVVETVAKPCPNAATVGTVEITGAANY